MTKLDYSSYLSPFSWRYGSEEMRRIFSEQHKYELWRKIWVELARAEAKAGLVSKKELDDLEKHQNEIDIERILEIEKETRHDVVAAIKEFAQKAKTGGGKIHLGATSMDVVDNAEAIRVKEALDLIEKKVINLLSLFSEKIEKYAGFPCIGYTHLQPAEPTTVGYRLSFYAQDLLIDYNFLQFVKENLKTKGMKGAVGTAASYKALLNGKILTVEDLEKEIMTKLELGTLRISTQVYTRKIDYLVLTILNSIASTFAKFAADLRILQSPSIGEWSEPFGKTQVGSSAMPFKKNPINSEKICSLARYISSLPQIALENASLSYLERTLDDSANRRIILPETFLALDEILKTSEKIISRMNIFEGRITYNLSLYAPFAASEAILMEAVKKGADRQVMHEVLREIALEAWQDVQNGKTNPMEKLLMENKEIGKYLKQDEIKKLLDVKNHIGNAPDRARKLVKAIKIAIK